MPEPTRRRGVLTGLLSVLALLGLAVSVGWGPAQTWWQSEPRTAAALAEDGSATIGAATIRLTRMEPSQQLALGYDVVDAPPGWVLWLATFQITMDPTQAGEEWSSDWVDVLALASDGKSYSRPRAFGLSSPPGGWLSYLPEESGQYQELIAMPDGVEPVSVRVLPSPPNPYWSLPLPD